VKDRTPLGVRSVNVLAPFEAGDSRPSVPEAREKAWDWKPEERQLELRMAREMRLLGEEVVARQRANDAKNPRRAKTRRCVEEFWIPSSRSSAPSVTDAFISRMRSDIVPLARASSTWGQLVGPWRRGRAFMRACVEADGKEWCLETLRADSRYATACAMWAFESSTTVGAVTTMVRAVRMAMRLNRIEIQDEFLSSMVISVARRQRALPVRKRAGVTFEEARRILRAWATDKTATAKWFIALAVAVGFSCLLRYSDIALIRIDAIYWMGRDGCAIFIPRRKNLQFGQGSWLILLNRKGSDGAEDPFSVFNRLRGLLARLRCPAEEGFCGVKHVREYLFRDVGGLTGHTHAHKRMDVWWGGEFPIAKAAYGHYLTRFREALRQCCGYSQADAKEFGMQSMRSGGNTHLFHEGLTQEQRMGLGSWMTPRVEMGYLRQLMSRKMEVLRGVQQL
jgi:hypothetical protein